MNPLIEALTNLNQALNLASSDSNDALINADPVSAILILQAVEKISDARKQVEALLFALD